MSKKIIGVTVGTSISPRKIAEKLNITPDVHVAPNEPTDENVYLWLKTSSANLLNIAINEDGTPFVGLKNGYYEYEDGTFEEGEPDEGYFYSGFIPVKLTDKLYFSGFVFDGMEFGIVLYDRDFECIRTPPIWDVGFDTEGNEIGSDAVEFDGDEIYWLDISELISRDFGEVSRDELARIAYIRLQGISEYTEDCAVTYGEGETDEDNVLKIKKSDGTWQDVTGAPELDSEEWVFELEDGNTVTKGVVVK